MVLKDIPNDTRLLIVLAARFYADGLGRSDLHVVNPLPVPDRLEDRVREAQHEHVLNSLFAEVVIDAIHLMLAEAVEDEIIEPQRRLEASSERLLDHDAHPRSDVRCAHPWREPARRQTAHDRLEHTRRHRQIEQPVALLRRAIAFDLLEPRADRLIRTAVGGVGRHVEEAPAERLPEAVVDPMHLLGRVERLAHLGAKAVVRLLVARHAEHREVLVREVLLHELVDRRQQLAPTEVAQRADDDHRARVRASRSRRRRRHLDGRSRRNGRRGHVCCTACPPNSLRSAAITFAPNESA